LSLRGQRFIETEETDMPENRERPKPKSFLPILSLRTQLVLILLFLLLISVTSLTIIYERSEGIIMEKVAQNIDDITKAIQISVEEPPTEVTALKDWEVTLRCSTGKGSRDYGYWRRLR
jgi:hypothetical protein